MYTPQTHPEAPGNQLYGAPQQGYPPGQQYPAGQPQQAYPMQQYPPAQQYPLGQPQQGYPMQQYPVVQQYPPGQPQQGYSVQQYPQGQQYPPAQLQYPQAQNQTNQQKTVFGLSIGVAVGFAMFCCCCCCVVPIVIGVAVGTGIKRGSTASDCFATVSSGNQNSVYINGAIRNTALLYRQPLNGGVTGVTVSASYSTYMNPGNSYYIGIVGYQADNCIKTIITYGLYTLYTTTHTFTSTGCYQIFYASRSGSSYSCSSSVTSGTVIGAVFVTDYTNSPTRSPTKSPV